MPLRSGSIGYARYLVQASGDSYAIPDEDLFAKLREHLLAPDIGEPKEIASGFCTGRHVFDGEFTYDACGFGASLLAAMRVDTAAVPSEIKRAYRTMAEDSRKKAQRDLGREGLPGLSRSDRKEAREEAEDRCRRDLADGKYRRIAMLPFLWDLPSGALLAPSTSDKQFQELKSLFDAALDLRLERRSAGTVALDILSELGTASALEDALPDALVKRPEGPESDADDVHSGGNSGAATEFRKKGRPEVPWAQAGGEPNDFLGNLFLLWLWWHYDEHEGVVEAGDITVALAIEKSLDMECAWGVTGAQALRGDAPTKLIEATKALQSGKWPRKMGLLLAAHGQEFRCTLHGDKFSVAGLVLPKGDQENRLSPRQMLEERIDALLTFDRMLTLLYRAFLRERFGKSWETRAGQLRAWIADRDRRRRSHVDASTEMKPARAAERVATPTA
ncbi:MAG: hypothetical protein JNM94_09905 [Phycisphaerae bacterium]|nr:hypothetical protein [Phycisphaerae bacterium]